MNPIRLVIVDDQSLYLEGLSELIAHWSNFRIVGLGANGRDAVDLYRELQPDLILLDVRMPKMSGIEATRCILEAFPSARVVMMSISNDNPGLSEAIRSGACGYFLKSVSPTQLQHLLQGWAVRELHGVDERSAGSE